MKIVDYTEKYNGQKYFKYLSLAIDHIPPKDLQKIGRLNVYDSCPDYFPVVAQGSHRSASRKEKGAIDIYLDCGGPNCLDSEPSKLSSCISYFCTA